MVGSLFGMIQRRFWKVQDDLIIILHLLIRIHLLRRLQAGNGSHGDRNNI